MTLIVREETPIGVGAVSVVRVLGEDALARVREFSERTDVVPGRPFLARLRCAGEDLDEALICALSAREVEIHLHGSPVLVRTLLAALAPHASSGGPATPTSASRAEPGAAERARSLLGSAPCEAGARILLDQAEGSWTNFLRDLSHAHDPRSELARASERSRVARYALEPAIVVLAGPVNAGKSTLFNALVGERRAITNASPGTTRDLVRARALLGRYPVELVDTAGERDASEFADALHPVERAGIERARAVRTRADLVLWLNRADGVESRVPAGAVALATHADRSAYSREPAVSALKFAEQAHSVVARLFAAHCALPDDPWNAGSGCAFDARSALELEWIAASADAADLRARAAACAANEPSDSMREFAAFRARADTARVAREAEKS